MATIRTTVDGYLIGILLDSSRSLSATSAVRVQASGRGVACNWATADFIISSPLMKEEYRHLTMGIEDLVVRWIPTATAAERDLR